MARTNTGQYDLSPADIMDLRLAAKSRGFISDGTNTGFPFITFILSDNSYALHSQGFTVAVHSDPEVMSALLRNERIEAGYVRRVTDPKIPIDEAAMSPEEARELRLRRDSVNARARDHAASLQAENERRESLRRSTPADHVALRLEDLL